MNMITHNVVQGTPEWLALRFQYNTASEAAAMLAISSKTSRQELVRMKALGNEKEFTEWVKKNILAKGHDYEDKARPWAEEILGEELYPATCSITVANIQLLASLDGMTMDESTIWEHKTLNQALETALEQGLIPAEYKPQLEQGLLVTGAQRCLFMASNGSRRTMLYAWYESDPVLRKQLLAGWKQFDEDRKNYEHVEVTPTPEGASIETLPALTVQVEGRVIASNLQAFEAAATDIIGRIKTDLQTDQDFADAEKAVKFCGEAESKLEMVKEQALSQTETIEQLFLAIDNIKEQLRRKRLDLDKLVKTRKEAIRAEIIKHGADSLAAHISQLNARLGGHFVRFTDSLVFAQAIKGKKTVQSCRDAVDAVLAQAKINTNEQAEIITSNQTSAGEHMFLFPDFGVVCAKDPEDFKALLALRINEHQARQEAERRQQEEAARQKAEQQEAQAAAPATPSHIPHAPPQQEPVTQAPVEDSRASVEEIIEAYLSEHVPTRSQKTARKYLTEFVEYSRNYRRQEAA